MIAFTYRSRNHCEDSLNCSVYPFLFYIWSWGNGRQVDPHTPWSQCDISVGKESQNFLTTLCQYSKQGPCWSFEPPQISSQPGLNTRELLKDLCISPSQVAGYPNDACRSFPRWTGDHMVYTFLGVAGALLIEIGPLQQSRVWL